MQPTVIAQTFGMDGNPPLSNVTTLQHSMSLVYEHYIDGRDPHVYKVSAWGGGMVLVIAFRHFLCPGKVTGVHWVYTPPGDPDVPCDCC